VLTDVVFQILLNGGTLTTIAHNGNLIALGSENAVFLFNAESKEIHRVKAAPVTTMGFIKRVSEAICEKARLTLHLASVGSYFSPS